MIIKTTDIKSTTIPEAIDEIAEMDIDFDYYANQFHCGTMDFIEEIATHIVTLDEDYIITE